VADRLGIGEEVKKKGRTAGGGKIAMELMAKSTATAIGLTQVRVRHHGEIARLEVRPEEFGKLMIESARRKVIAGLKKLGYAYIALDLEGYRTGSLNEPLRKSAKSRRA